MSTGVLFNDRRDAGRQLGAALGRFAGKRPLVLALPRGGVPVGFEVARALRADLDILIVRKIGAPGSPELGLGAVLGGRDPQIVLNDDMVRRLAVGPAYLEGETARQLAEIERRRARYRGDRPASDLQGRCVIVVDDGVATGGTVKVALTGVRREAPSCLVLAIPVAPPEVVRDLLVLADEVICLATPAEFQAVGAYYGDFTQTDDTEVVDLLALSRA